MFLTSATHAWDRLTLNNVHVHFLGWDDIGYNFLVGGDGRVYVGRGFHRVGAHTRGYNDRSLAVSLMGNYVAATPGDAMLRATENLIQCAVDQVRIWGICQDNSGSNGFCCAEGTSDGNSLVTQRGSREPFLP